MREHTYWMYNVVNRTSALHIGMTGDQYVRVMQHKSGEVEGVSTEYKCNRLVWWKSFDEVTKAINYEKQLKGWRRSKKIALIQSPNTRWADLAEHCGAEMAFAGQSMKDRRERVAAAWL